MAKAFPSGSSRPTSAAFPCARVAGGEERRLPLSTLGCMARHLAVPARHYPGGRGGFRAVNLRNGPVEPFHAQTPCDLLLGERRPTTVAPSPVGEAILSLHRFAGPRWRPGSGATGAHMGISGADRGDPAIGSERRHVGSACHVEGRNAVRD